MKLIHFFSNPSLGEVNFSKIEFTFYMRGSQLTFSSISLEVRIISKVAQYSSKSLEQLINLLLMNLRLASPPQKMLPSCPNLIPKYHATFMYYCAFGLISTISSLSFFSSSKSAMIPSSFSLILSIIIQQEMSISNNLITMFP